MRQLLAVILASTFLTTAPVVVNSGPAEAQSLFEVLFPRAAERRRKRKELEIKKERQKRARARIRAGGGAKIKAPTFKKYAPTKLTTIKLTKLAPVFTAYEEKLLLEKNQPADDAVETTAAIAPATDANPAVDGTVASQADSGQVAATAPIVEGGTQPEVAETELPLSAESGLAVVAEAGAEAEGVVQPTLASQTVAVEDAGPEPVRLSSGYEQLSSINLRARKSLGQAVIAHYSQNPSFIWIDEKGEINDKARSALRVLADANSYGLRMEDYALPVMVIGDDATEAELLQASMEFEFAMSAAALRYLSDARNGVVDPNRISGYHDFKDLAANYEDLLQSVSTENDVAEYMLGQHPQDDVFDALRKELAQLRETAVGYESIEIKSKTFIRPGQTNDQLENIVESVRRKASDQLLADHFDAFAVDHSEGVYSDTVVAMIKDFQEEEGLKRDGIIGRNTIAKMKSADPNVRLNKVLYAMERLRWHPDQLGSTHVFINQPAYRASYMVGGQPELSMRAIVGKRSNQTNFFHDTIEYVEYNPYWGVPQSILVNEMLPKLVNNPSYLDNLGYEVTNQSGRRISSSSVDWWNVGRVFPYNVRQPPGRKNALGELKIMFPNKHSIYMHDTPSRGLFRRNERALSHGCVRLADPRGMAAAVLGSDVNHVASKLAGGRNKTQQLDKKIPVYVAYFTAWPDENGDVKFYNDMYGRDAA
ncbi:MAG: L,D-transpeptidase family protein, partial [Rhizobiaceae bacterium]